MNQSKLFAVFAVLGSFSSAFADGPVQGGNVLPCSKEEFASISSLQGSITKVVDGDTVGILLRGGNYRIRMVGIDTPETHFQGQSQGYWGDVAAERLTRLLALGTRVRVRLSGEKCDSYGRILGEVFIAEKSMNDAQLISGHAVNYCIYPDEGCLEKSDLVREAIQKGRGFYGAHPRLEQLPYVWRDTIRGTAPHRFLGNLRTHRVYPPGSFRSVPIADRIFFNTEADIVAPYFLVR